MKKIQGMNGSGGATVFAVRCAGIAAVLALGASFAAVPQVAFAEDLATGAEASAKADVDAAPAPERDEATGRTANSWRFTDGLYTGANGGISLLGSAVTWERQGDTYVFSNGVRDSRATAVGIDVSEWQHTIDWNKVKAAGVDYAIIRCGWGGNSTSQDDSMFIENVRGCQAAGIPFGVYLYSYADSADWGKNEAEHVLRLLKAAGLSPDDVEFPVYLDLEQETNGKPLASASTLLEVATAFCETIEGAGYTPGVYANLNWWNNYLTSSTYNRWERWVAQYNETCDYKGDYGMWQLTSDGSVPGIDGRVDLNLSYRSPLLRDEHGVRYIQKDGTILKNSWGEYAGDRYYFGSDGYALTGERDVDGHRYYFNNDGTMHTGWKTWEDGTRSYFSVKNDGAAAKGWWTIGGKRYYFDAATRRALTGERMLGGKLYLFNGAGDAKEGWHTWPDGSRSYFSKDAKGAAAKGFWKLGGKYYYFNLETRRALTGEQRIDDKLYLFGTDGAATTGWHAWEDGSRSYFARDAKGAAAKSFWSLSGSFYYFDLETRRALTGEHWIDGKLYLFDDDGAATQGWHSWPDGTRSYFAKNNKGAAAKGWWTLSGDRYYFSTDDRRALTGEQVIDGVTYHFDVFGALIDEA